MNQIFNVKINKIDNFDLIKSIEDKCLNEIPLTKEEVDYLLNYVCYSVRKKLADSKSADINEYDYANQCDKAQAMIYYYLEKIGVSCKPMQTNGIIKDCLGHSFIIAFVNQDDTIIPYIIDPTYNQFFKEDKCTSDNLQVINNIVVKTPYPGYFILDETEKNQEIIKKFLKNGFMELTEDNVRIYGDSFYKTQVGVSKDILEMKTMPGSIYIKSFLKSDFKLSHSEEDLIQKNLYLDVLDKNEFKIKNV